MRHPLVGPNGEGKFGSATQEAPEEHEEASRGTNEVADAPG